MKMFPHAFFPFFPVHLDVATSKITDGNKTTEPPVTRARAISTRPVKIDVEKAVTVMLATSEVRNDSARQKCRLDVIKAVPAHSIDWDTVNWVQMRPFQTIRL